MRDNISLVITDSGLGGLSVVANLANVLVEKRNFRKVEMVYFNAWPSRDCTYNSLPSLAAKARIFDAALQGMIKFNPDMILIACNTLSTLYPATSFSLNSAVKVVDIIDFGVKMIYDKLLACENSKVLILGTPTTIDSEAHRAALLKLGIDSSRIVAQSCPALAGEIEKNPQSSEVETLIAKYVKSARAQMKITSDTQLFAALCCTHYGYSQEVFQSRLDQLFEQRVIILNPNIKMSEECLPESSRSYPATAINLKIVSRIQLDQSKITAISGILVKTSPLVADALNHYHYDEELFRLK